MAASLPTLDRLSKPVPCRQAKLLRACTFSFRSEAVIVCVSGVAGQPTLLCVCICVMNSGWRQTAQSERSACQADRGISRPPFPCLFAFNIIEHYYLHSSIVVFASSVSHFSCYSSVTLCCTAYPSAPFISLRLISIYTPTSTHQQTVR